jgi:hypothetical protein
MSGNFQQLYLHTIQYCHKTWHVRTYNRPNSIIGGLPDLMLLSCLRDYDGILFKCKLSTASVRYVIGLFELDIIWCKQIFKDYYIELLLF